MISILISSHNRLPLMRRSLWSIAHNKPQDMDVEVVIADDASTDDILGEVQKYGSTFYWKFIRVNVQKFTEETGISPFWNNPALTNNIAFRHSCGNPIFLMGNDIIAWKGSFQQMLDDCPSNENFIMFSHTYDLKQEVLDALDENGAGLTQAMVDYSKRWALQSHEYRSDVTNYMSLCPRNVWETIQGYDERYLGGISAEDSDFVRRARTLPNLQTVISEAVSLHQYHQGKTRYYDPPPEVITKERFQEGCKINHVIYDQWNGLGGNPQNWKWGTLGITDVIDSKTYLKKEYMHA